MYNTDLPERAELPSAAQLLKSTVIAAVMAALILFTAVLPAEYGIDPTGVGRLLGLTPMGHIKQGLAKEAAAEAAPVGATSEPAPPPATAVAPAVAAASASPTAAPATGIRTDEVSFVLNPGQAAEYKLTMKQGATARFEWTSAGGRVNYDTHGDPVNAPKSFYHGYDKGRDSPGQEGQLTAAFDGSHGWFWRNRGSQAVTITLKTRGEYTAIKRVV